jgi:hypothetical protein
VKVSKSSSGPQPSGSAAVRVIMTTMVPGISLLR